ncbi:MAG: hypothetical protein IJN76_04795 [Clostridia bacterium]|nr:hypothetical protein [Clostridia bacterium]
MKKIIALLACLCLLLPMSVYFVAADSTLEDAPVAGTPYKFGMVQGNVSATDVYYLAGGMAQTYYLATTTDANAAIDVYLEETAGGYYLYTQSGSTKTYINMVVNGTHVNGVYESTASTVYTYDTEHYTLTAEANGEPYWFGTRNDKTYTTVGPCAVSFAGFYCQFYTVTGGTTPDPDEPIIPDEPIDDGAATLDFGDKANRVSYSTEQQVWAQNGITVTNDKAASTSNVGDYGGEGYPARFYKSSALKVEYTGMTKIVFNCDDYKASYPTDLAASITTGNVAVDGTVVTVTFDAPVDSLVIDALAAQVRVDSIAVYGNEEPDEPITPPVNPDEPIVPDEPAADSVLSIKDAIALGQTKENNTYTEGKYYITGQIVVINSAQYGNMYIRDAEGNQLYVYGTYSADGSISYGDMDAKPDAGDTVTLYSAVGSYNDKPQLKNAWIISYEEGELEDDNNDPAADSALTVKEAIDLGLSKLHDVYTEGKYYVTAEITEIYNEQFSNMRVTDADGNILTIYGTYDADGTNRFDAMETQPQVGDTVKLYGIIGQYNGTPQMKNGWIIAINPEEPTVDPDDPTVDPDDPTVDPDEPIVDPDEPVDTEPMGENMTLVMVAGIIALIAAAATVLFAKKRA